MYRGTFTEESSVFSILQLWVCTRVKCSHYLDELKVWNKKLGVLITFPTSLRTYTSFLLVCVCVCGFPGANHFLSFCIALKMNQMFIYKCSPTLASSRYKNKKNHICTSNVLTQSGFLFAQDLQKIMLHCSFLHVSSDTTVSCACTFFLQMLRFTIEISLNYANLYGLKRVKVMRH